MRIKDLCLLKKVGMIMIIGIMSSMVYAESEIFTYNINNYPTTSDECMKQATVFGNKFRDETGLDIFNVGCVEAKYDIQGGYTITISYISDKPEIKGTLIRDLNYGGYDTPQACKEDLDNQLEMYEEETGLEIFTGYCSPKGYLNILSLGGSNVERYLFNSYFLNGYNTVLIDDENELEQSIINALEQKGVRISRVSIISDRPYIYYYSPKEIYLSFLSDTGYKTGSECESEKYNLINPIKLLGGDVIHQFCASSDYYPVPEKVLISLVYNTKPMGHYGSFKKVAPGNYEDLSSCNDDKERIKKIYKEKLNKNVFGSLCTLTMREPKNYQMLIFVD